jgi:polyisoprenoid-binding protein YceI
MRSNDSQVARRLLVLIPAALAFSGVHAPMSLTPGSRLWVEGTSTVRSWTCRATAIDAAIETNGPGATTAVIKGEKAVRTVSVTIPAAKLECGNGTMNSHLQKALKAAESPTITFRVSSYDIEKGGPGVTGTLNGQLTIGGTTKPVAVQAAGQAAPDGTLHVTGTHDVVMTQFGLKPPTLMMGTMKVGDKVKVSFDLYLKD